MVPDQVQRDCRWRSHRLHDVRTDCGRNAWRQVWSQRSLNDWFLAACLIKRNSCSDERLLDQHESDGFLSLCSSRHQRSSLDMCHRSSDEANILQGRWISVHSLHVDVQSLSGDGLPVHRNHDSEIRLHHLPVHRRRVDPVHRGTTMVHRPR